MKKVTRKELIILAVIFIAFSLFVFPWSVFKAKEGTSASARKGGKVYYCPMHPTYTSDRSGDCPICNMKLVPREDSAAKKERKILYYRHPMGQPDTSPVPKKDSMGMDYLPVYDDEVTGAPSQVPGHAAVQIPSERQQLMGVKLGTVEKRKLAKEIRTTGRVAFDPELFTTQREFLSALASSQASQASPYHEPIERAEALVESTKIRLRLLGMSEEEIAELEKKGTQDKNLILPAGLDASMTFRDQGVWVYATLYEYEISFVKPGVLVKVRVPTFPDREFLGEVRAVTPVLEAATRSIRVRVRVQDLEGLLRPEMYVDVYLEADLGEKTALPEEAAVFTGERTIVFVSKGGGHFEPREVTLGTKAGNFYPVESGLEAGEKVAVSGNFLIDSESRLQAALQGMAGGGHVHGQ